MKIKKTFSANFCFNNILTKYIRSILQFDSQTTGS